MSIITEFSQFSQPSMCFYVKLFQTIYNIANITAGFNVSFPRLESPDRTHNCYTAQGEVEARCLEHYINPVVDKPSLYDVDLGVMMKAITALKDANFVQLFNIKGKLHSQTR